MKSLKTLWNSLQLRVLQSRNRDGSRSGQRSVWTPPVLAAVSVLVLGCWIAVAAGKGKPDKGNQPIPGPAVFSGDIVSNGLLMGGFVDHGDFETLTGNLEDGETLTVAGVPGATLVAIHNAFGGDVLPMTAMIGADAVTFSDATWSIRLDNDEVPQDRVQLKIQWFNDLGEFHSFDMGLFPPDPEDFGEVIDGVSPASLTDATVVYLDDPFRVRANLLAGKGKKTERFVYSNYNQDGISSCTIETLVP